MNHTRPTTARLVVHGPGQLLRAFRKRVVEAWPKESEDVQCTEQHGKDALQFHLITVSGVPFPALMDISTQYPECVATVHWERGSDSGETTIQNGQVKGASTHSALHGNIPHYIELAVDGTLRLALGLDVQASGLIGYCAVASAETWFRLEGDQDSPKLFTIGGQAIAWDEVWSNGTCQALLPSLPLSTNEHQALENLARHFHTDWLWYGHAPEEDIAVELQRFLDAERHVMPVNVKSRRIAGMPALKVSQLDARQLWIVDLLQHTWARTSFS